MQRTIQLSVFLENKPGTLAKVCEELARQSINILALTVADTIDHAIVRMVVDDPRRALLMFEERGTHVTENEVIVVEGQNRPGSLAEIANRLAQADVNILYGYLATPSGEDKGLLVMRTSDNEKAAAALES